MLLIIAAAGYFVYTQQVQHQSRPEQPRTVRITAVGDSLTHGVGDQTGKGGYPNLIQKKINRSHKNIVATAENYGISGETTNQINHRVVTSKRLRSSLRSATVVTITTGGNDMLHFLKDHIATNNQKSLQRDLSQYTKDYRLQIRRLLGHVRQLNARAPIFIFGIYNPVYVYFPQVSFIGHAITLNNQVTTKVAARTKQTYFISIDKQLSDGQYQTARSRAALRKKAVTDDGGQTTANQLEMLLNGQSTVTNRYISTADHFHPNLRGYKIMTNLLYKSMQKHISWLKG